MFDNKNRKDDLSSDEWELMEMIKEYERDEAEEQLQESKAPHDEHDVMDVADHEDDTALGNHRDHTKVMSRDQLDDKTLTIMPVGKGLQEESVNHIQDLDFSQLEGDAEDDDPRFELHRKKDQKPKKQKNKKPKKDKPDKKLNKTILITIVIAVILAVIAGGFLIYNSFFRDKKANDDKVTEVTKAKDKKKNDKKPEAPKEEEPKEPPKDDHTAEINKLQGLINQERTKYNNFVNQANTLQEQMNAYRTSYNALQDKVDAAQADIDAAGDQATDDQKEALQTAQDNLDDFKKHNPNPPTQQQIDDAMSQAQASLDRINDYQHQISQYQNS